MLKKGCQNIIKSHFTQVYGGGDDTRAVNVNDEKSYSPQSSGRTIIFLGSAFGVLAALFLSSALLVATVLRHPKIIRVTDSDFARN
jgi:hypothetical protein